MINCPMGLGEQIIQHIDLVIRHVSRSSTKFGISLDHFVNSIKEILLGRHLSSSADCEHTGLCADTTNISTWKYRDVHDYNKEI